MFTIFRKSEALLDKALQIIPGGTGTFSKSHTLYPRGISPFYLSHGKGSHVWDVDGNEYIDFVNGLTAVTLGYQDEDVDAAVREQMGNGVIFGLPHKLEIAVAELICEMVPCAEMVRYGKNGSDATSGAVRLARAYTGRDHVAHCGYHGWPDVFNGVTGRNAGVPQAVRDLTHTFEYNNPDSLERLMKDRPNQYSCIIMEPMNREYPRDNFLEKCQAIAHKWGALFILDEVITGFRFTNGGAQELFGITPDLATFGKGIANGYPLSAIAGKAEIMRKFTDVHYSFTYSGECLSLAAAKATLTKLKNEPVCEHLKAQGQKVIENSGAYAQSTTACEGVLKCGVLGYPAWIHLYFCDTRTKTLFMQETMKRGILTTGGTLNMSYSHSDADIDRLLTVCGEAFSAIQNGAELECELPQAGFKIR